MHNPCRSPRRRKKSTYAVPEGNARRDERPPKSPGRAHAGSARRNLRLHRRRGTNARRCSGTALPACVSARTAASAVAGGARDPTLSAAAGAERGARGGDSRSGGSDDDDAVSARDDGRGGCGT